MSVFRKRALSFSMPSSGVSMVRDLRSVVSVVNGIETSREILVDVTPEEYHNEHPINMEDFSLKDQIEAGVNFREIPCGTLLDSSDNMDYGISDVAEDIVLEQLETAISDEDKQTKKD